MLLFELSAFFQVSGANAYAFANVCRFVAPITSTNCAFLFILACVFKKKLQYERKKHETSAETEFAIIDERLAYIIICVIGRVHNSSLLVLIFTFNQLLEYIFIK